MSRFGGFVVKDTVEASRAMDSPASAGGSFIAAMTGGGRSSKPVEGSLMEHMKSKRGPKSSKERVVVAEQVFAKLNLSFEEQAVLVSMIKRLPSSSPADAAKQHAENKRLGNESAKTIAVDANLDLTRPRLTQEAEFKVYMAILEKIYRISPQPISWGVIIQLQFMKEIGRELGNEFMKVAPNLRDIMMKKSFPNLVEFKIWATIVEFRFMALVESLNWLVEKGASFKLINKGTKLANGRYVLNDFMRLETPPSSIPKKVEMGSSEGDVKISSFGKENPITPGQLFAAAGAMNFRYGRQLAEIRRGRVDPSFKSASDSANRFIIRAMKSVIKLYDERAYERLDTDDVDLSSKSAFTQTYNQALAFFAATWRSVMIDLYGIAGGADTRTNDSVVTAEVDGDMFPALKFKVGSA